MLIVSCLAGLALGGIGRRVAGGVIGDWTGWAPPHLVATLFFGACIGSAFALGGGPLWLAAVLGFGVWAGHCSVGLRDAAGMGHFGQDNALFTWRRFVRDFAALSLYGLAVVGLGLVAAVAANFTLNFTSAWPALLAAGLAISPVYAACWALWEHRWLPLLPGVSRNPLELAEWTWGGVLGLGAALAGGL